MVNHKLWDFFSKEISSGVLLKNKTRKQKIIRYIDKNEEATITKMAKTINISTPKTTSLVNELIELGLLRDCGKINSLPGRPANIFGLAANSCFFLGVDVKEYYINIGLMDFTKNMVTTNMRIPYLLQNTPESFDLLISLIKNFIRQEPVNPKNILSICINIGGRIDTKSDTSHSYFHFNEDSISSIIESRLSIRAFLENDSRAMAYGEFQKGIVKNEKNVLFLNLDYGMGMGILIDGKVYYGKSGFSGEFGHTPFFDNEILCCCGKKGCLETEASGRALIRLFKERIRQGQTSSIIKNPENLNDIRLTDIIEAALNEDMLSIDLLAEVGKKIGRSVALLINIFNSEMVILGGPMMDSGDYIYLPICSAINKYSITLINSDTKLVISQLGEKAGVMGGCLIARNKLLSRP